MIPLLRRTFNDVVVKDDAMHVVYRMRGLLGEATEDMIERLDSDKTEDDEEEIYKLASVLGECGGIEVRVAFFITSFSLSTNFFYFKQ